MRKNERAHLSSQIDINIIGRNNFHLCSLWLMQDSIKVQIFKKLYFVNIYITVKQAEFINTFKIYSVIYKTDSLLFLI